MIQTRIQRGLSIALIMGLLLAGSLSLEGFKPQSASAQGSCAVQRISGPTPSTGGVSQYEVSPNGNFAVYRSNALTGNSKFELFSVPMSGGSSTKLHGTLPANGSILSFAIAPDSNRVVYLMDGNTTVAGQAELYSVPIGGGTPVKLSGPQVAFGDVMDFKISQVGNRVAYMGDQLANNVVELFIVPIDGSAGPLRLNSNLPTNGSVSAFDISPDGTRVVYIADQNTTNIKELFSIPVTGGASQRLNLVPQAWANVAEFKISPISNRVAYLTDQDTDNSFELYSVPITGGVVSKMNTATGTSARDVTEFEFSPDGARLVFIGDIQVDERFELFSNTVGGNPASMVKLNGAMISTGDVRAVGNNPAFQISPNSSWVVYTADQLINEVDEIFSVPIMGGAATKLNGTLVNGSVEGFALNAASTGLIYRTLENDGAKHSIFAVALTGGASNPLRVTNSSANIEPDLVYTNSGSRILFFDVVPPSTTQQLYSMTSTGGDLQRINDNLATNTYIASFSLAKTGNKVAYRTQRNSPTFLAELFSSCDGGAQGSIIRSGHSLALFNPNNGQMSKIDTLQNPPPANAYNTYNPGGPIQGQWVLGDWDGNGTDTPGVFNAGAFHFTNDTGPSANWSAHWVGPTGPVVAGRFNPDLPHDCFGVIEEANLGGFTVYVLYYICDYSTVTPVVTWHWVSAVLYDPALPGLEGVRQFSVGDWNGDGAETMAVRRGPYIAFSNIKIVDPDYPHGPPFGPNNTGAEFAFAQYWGVGPGGTGYGQFVTGDWNNDGEASFGVVYDNNVFYYRNNLEWDNLVYIPQQFSSPVGSPRNVVTWQRVLSGSSIAEDLEPVEGLTDLGGFETLSTELEQTPLQEISPLIEPEIQPINPDDLPPLDDFYNGDSGRTGAPPSDLRLSSSLSNLYTAHQNNPTAAYSVASTYQIEFAGDLVRVNILTQDNASAQSIISSLSNLGGLPTAHYENSIDVALPVGMLERLARLPGVVIVQDLQTVELDSGAQPAPQSLVLNTGSAISQGVALSNANAWHNVGHTGQGVKVAVLDSFQDYTQAQALGELPSNITPLGTLDLNSRHGTAVAEIIYDMAPGVQFTFASPSTATEMASLITQLAQSGHRVISSSLSFDNIEPGDGTGIVSNAINAAYTNHGTLYVQSAGNRALSHWHGAFKAFGGSTIPTQEFMSSQGPTNVNQIGHVTAGQPIRLAMRWNGWPTTTQDYDLVLVIYDPAIPGFKIHRNAQGNPIGSFRNQAGLNLSPIETLNYTASVTGFYGFVIEKFQADGNQVLNIVSRTQNFVTEAKADYSLSDPAPAPGAFTVAAISRTPPYNLEASSSRGPSFGAGGTLTGPFVQNPRISAYVGVDTWAYGTGIFTGTSAAAPHVSGAAALVFGEHPDWNATQVRNFLEGRAMSLGSPYNTGYGVGRLHLGEPATPAPSESLALFSPSTNQAVLVNSIQDNPPPAAYNAYTLNPPIAANAANQWVMGDWNGDGTDTPGVFASGAFHLASNNTASATWSSHWVGPNGTAIAGRFNSSLDNDCIGVLEQAALSGYTVFALWYACDLSTNTPAVTWHWVSAPLPDVDGFSGAFQFTTGDWNGDGRDSLAARRGENIAFSNIPIVNPAAVAPQTPSNTYAEFTGAQYWGAPDAAIGIFVGGNWNGASGSSFGVFYSNRLIYRNNVAWNEPTNLTQNLSFSLPQPLNVAAWRSTTASAIVLDGVQPLELDSAFQNLSPEVEADLSPELELAPLTPFENEGENELQPLDELGN